MLRRVFALALGIVALAQPALAQVPDPAMSTATSASGHILMSLGGGYASLADAGLTITVVINDSGGSPVSGVAANRIRLDSSNVADLVECPTDNTADAATDLTGTTTFSGILFGGGFKQGDLRVYVDGVAIPSVIDIEINSTDLNADLLNNIADLGAFASDLAQPFVFRSDLWRDDVMDIADLAVYALFFADSCP